MAHSVELIAVISLVTIMIRFLPFVIFPAGKELPKTLVYLSNVLPAAVMGMLVVYCFRNTEFTGKFHGLPEIIASGVVILLHVWKKNFLISIAAGTIVYMLLVQLVFI